MEDQYLRYLQDISELPRLTAEEESQLSTAIRAGDERALEALVRANLRIVPTVAAEYHDSRVPVLDLLHEGDLALVRAARAYTGGPCRFACFAMPVIRAAMEAAGAQAPRAAH